jgi:hypothetical protein
MYMTTRFAKMRLYVALAMDTIIFVIAAFTAASILYGWSWSDTTAPRLLGNRPEVISGLVDGQSELKPFSFTVVGDPRSSSAFEEFYQNTPLDAVPDFGVILGDFVAFPAVNRHRFFMGELAEWGMTFPVFLIAGNHDIGRRSDFVSNAKRERKLYRLHDPFFKEDFEEIYGPTNFSFIYRGCLFIGLNDVYNTGYLGYLEDVLARRPSDVIITFVFMHIPPRSLSPMVQAREMEGEEEFMRLMDHYTVDYVFAGDFHSYFRADRKHTKYIVTGGGGSHLRGGGRGFHHALLMTVNPAKDRVDEVIYPIKPVFDPGDSTETIMICVIYPIFEGHRLIWMAVFSLVALVLAARIAVLLARIVRKGHRLR